ncbi:MAG TPA: IMS domain-containing protein, partial [Chroococcales cyanobacterium]
MRRPVLKLACSLVLLSLAGTWQGSLGADSSDGTAEGSMDTIWSDVSSQGQAATGASSATSSASSSSGGAPLCPLNVITESALIKSGGWPGIGPFRDAGGEYVDAEMNRLKLRTKGSDVTAAELHVTTPPRGFINLEMTADFLLESVGAQPAKIADFNSQLEKDKIKLLASTADNPLNLAAGRYVVRLHKDAAAQSSDSSVKKQAFVIQVKSNQEASAGESFKSDTAVRESVKEPVRESVKDETAEAPEEAPAPSPKKIAARPKASPTKRPKAATETPRIETVAPPETEVEAPVKASAPVEAESPPAVKSSKAVAATPADTMPAETSSDDDTAPPLPSSPVASADTAMAATARAAAAIESNSSSADSDTSKSGGSKSGGNKSKKLFGFMHKSKDRKLENDVVPPASATAAEKTSDLKPAADESSDSSRTAADAAKETTASTTRPATASSDVNGWQTSTGGSASSSSSDFTITKPSLEPQKIAMTAPTKRPPAGSSGTASGTSRAPGSAAPGSAATPSVAKTAESGDSLKQQFQTIIEGWQKVKRIAVKERNVNDLALILSGKTLLKQTNAIKWLIDNHMYYEMTPESVAVKKYTAVVPNQKYLVTTEIHEGSKLINEAQNNAVVKESDSTYTVN